MATRESSIVKRIIDNLNKLEGCLVRKRHGGPYSVAGDPDITGSYQGLHIEIEAKNERGRLTALQKHRLQEWVDKGQAYATWVRSFEGAQDFIREIDRDIERGERKGRYILIGY